MNNIIIFTAHSSGVQVPIIDYLISNNFQIKCILFENKDNINTKKECKILQTIKWLFNRWGHFCLIYPFLKFHFKKRAIKKRLIKESNEAKLNHKKPLNELNTLDDLASKHKITIMKVSDINSFEAEKKIASMDLDLGICLASKIIKPNIFTIPKKGTINLHSMSLPQFRGLSPVGFRETIAGMDQCGIHFHFIEESLDTGPILESAYINLRTYKFDLNIISYVAVRRAKKLALLALNKVFLGVPAEKQDKSIKSVMVRNPTSKEMLQYYKTINKLKNIKNAK